MIRQRESRPVVSFLCAVLATLTAEAGKTDRCWSQWRGPADGTACITNAPGPDLRPAWILDMLDPNGDGDLEDDMGYAYHWEVYRYGSLVRADDNAIFLKRNGDYMGNNFWKINPVTGRIVWETGSSSGEDMGSPRVFQLTDDPAGFPGIFVGTFYGCTWNVCNRETGATSTRSEMADYHSVSGSQLLMGNWAWRGTGAFPGESAPFYHHAGYLKWWNGSWYETRVSDPNGTKIRGD